MYHHQIFFTEIFRKNIQNFSMEVSIRFSRSVSWNVAEILLQVCPQDFVKSYWDITQNLAWKFIDINPEILSITFRGNIEEGFKKNSNGSLHLASTKGFTKHFQIIPEISTPRFSKSHCHITWNLAEKFYEIFLKILRLLIWKNVCEETVDIFQCRSVLFQSKF